MSKSKGWKLNPNAEQRARKALEQASWEREHRRGVPESVQKHRTQSTTGSKTWQKRVRRQDQTWSSMASPVQVKQKCLICGVVYAPGVDEHSC